MWAGLIQSGEGLKSKTEVSQRRRNSASRQQHQPLPEFPACPTGFRLAGLCNGVSQFPEANLFMYPICIMYLSCIFIRLVLLLWRPLPAGWGQEDPLITTVSL